MIDAVEELLRTTAGFTSGPIGHGSFATSGSLASVTDASYPVLVHLPTDAFHASFRRSVALPPLRFPFFAVTCSEEDFHLQDDAHAGRTKKPPAVIGPPVALYFESLLTDFHQKRITCLQPACTRSAMPIIYANWSVRGSRTNSNGRRDCRSL